MIKYFYPTVLFLLIAPFAKSQLTTNTEVKKDSTIKVTVFHQGKNSSLLYTVNGEPITRSTLDKLLMSYPLAETELISYKVQKRKAMLGMGICAVVAISSAILAKAQIDQQKNSPGSNFSKSPFFNSLSIVGIIGELCFALKRNDHFGKAIEAYNSRF